MAFTRGISVGQLEKYTTWNSAIESYLNDISHYKMLDADEELEIINKIKDGDEKAKEELILANQRFVFSVAKKYAKSNGSNILDLVSEGNIGLITAIDNFDSTKGFRFLSYAVWWIRQAILYYLSSVDTLVKNNNRNKTIWAANRLRNEFFLKNGRYPELTEFFDYFNERTGYNLKKVSDLIPCSVSSIDSTVNDKDGDSQFFGDTEMFNSKTAVINDYGDDGKEELKDYCDKLVSILTDEEREIIEESYGFNEGNISSAETIGRKLKKSPTYVIYKKKRALNKLKKEIVEKSFAV